MWTNQIVKFSSGLSELSIGFVDSSLIDEVFIAAILFFRRKNKWNDRMQKNKFDSIEVTAVLFNRAFETKKAKETETCCTLVMRWFSTYWCFLGRWSPRLDEIEENDRTNENTFDKTRNGWSSITNYIQARISSENNDNSRQKFHDGSFCQLGWTECRASGSHKRSLKRRRSNRFHLISARVFFEKNLVVIWLKLTFTNEFFCFTSIE